MCVQVAMKVRGYGSLQELDLQVVVKDLVWMLGTELQSLQQWHAVSTWEAGTGGCLCVQDQPGLQHELQDSQDCFTENPVSKKQTKWHVFFTLEPSLQPLEFLPWEFQLAP